MAKPSASPRPNRLSSLLVVLASGVIPSSALAADPAAPQPSTKPAVVILDKTDVSARVRNWNTERYSPPPTQFNDGKVTQRTKELPEVRKTEKGFSIKFPSGAPIPTPTVYAGKLYASGGFHSREFYCFDAATGKSVWSVDLDDDGPTSAVAAERVIIFNTESCTMFAVDADTGKMLWSHFLGDPLATTPTICNGRVFTSYPAAGQFMEKEPPPKHPDKSAPKGHANPPAKEQTAEESLPPTHVLACFDLKSGKIVWQRWIDGDVMSGAVASDEDLFVTTVSGAVYRFNQADGALRSARYVRATSAPVVVGNDVFFTRRADDGKGQKVAEAIVKTDQQFHELFVAARREAPYLDAVVQANSKFSVESLSLGASNAIGGGGFGGGGAFQVVDNGGSGKAAKPGDGEVSKANGNKANGASSAAGKPAVKLADAATFSAAAANIGFDNVSALQAFQGSRMVHADKLNFNCMGDQILCTEAATGRVVWSQKLDGDLKEEGGYLAAPPAAAGGRIFLATLKGDILELDPTKGTTIERFHVGAPLRFQPTITDGRIYVGTQDGQVVCIDTGDKKLTGWSTWGGNSAHTGVVK